MTPLQNLYYALGELAYAMAKADGQVQSKEKDKLHYILQTEFGKSNSDIDTTEIIFNVLQKDAVPAEVAYERAIIQFQLCSHYISDQLKQQILNTLHSLAVAFPPLDIEEHKMLLKTFEELKKIKGDPTFTNN